MMRRYCLTIDLKDDPALIAKYCEYHAAVWPGVATNLRQAWTPRFTSRYPPIHDVRSRRTFFFRSWECRFDIHQSQVRVRAL
jgi:L-rhamnose mutarotase